MLRKGGAIVCITFLTLIAFSSCTRKGCTDAACSNYDAKAKEDDGTCDCESAAFNIESMLEQYADNVIIGQYTTLVDSLNALKTDVEALDTNDLTSFRARVLAANVLWNKVQFFEFGPAESVLLLSNCNTFPTDTSKIDANVVNGSYNLSAISNYQAKGFPALDYLLNKSDSITTLEKAYVADVITDLHTLIASVHSEWTTNYRATFVASTGTDVASSLSKIVNSLNKEMDLIKNARVGIPAGKKTYGTLLVKDVESYYGRNSLELLSASMDGFESYLVGDTLGLFEYMDSKNATYDGKNLTTAITDQLAIVRANIAAINGNLVDAIANEKTKVDTLHDNLVDLLYLTKTEMPAVLEVLIQYEDNDGD